mgnify:CR=1 FL=1
MRGRNARGSNHARVESWTGVLRLGTATTLRRRVAPTRRGSRESLQKSRPTPCEPAVTGLEMGIRQRFAGGQQGATIGPKLFREWWIRGAERRVGPRSDHAANAGSRQPDLRVGGVELRARRTAVGLGRAPGRAPEPHTFRGPSSCPLPMKVPGFLDCGHSHQRRGGWRTHGGDAVSYTHLRAHETVLDIVCRLLLEKKNTIKKNKQDYLGQPT